MRTDQQKREYWCSNHAFLLSIFLMLWNLGPCGSWEGHSRAGRFLEDTSECGFHRQTIKSRATPPRPPLLDSSIWVISLMSWSPQGQVPMLKCWKYALKSFKLASPNPAYPAWPFPPSETTRKLRLPLGPFASWLTLLFLHIAFGRHFLVLSG